MKPQQGYILIATLIFTQLYSLLGLTALEQAFIAQKSVSQQKTHRLLLNQAQLNLYRLAYSPNLGQAACLIPVTTASDLRSQSPSWWSSHACPETTSLFTSYYVIESLAQDPCGQIKGQEISLAVSYYRLTLLLLKEHDEASKIMLQSTVIQGEKPREACTQKRHIVDWGPLVWREI